MEKKATKKITKAAPKKVPAPKEAPVITNKKAIKKTQVRKIKDFNVHVNELAKVRSQKKKQLEAFIKLDTKQIEKAVKCLQAFNEKKQDKKQLLEDEEGFIYIDVLLNKLPDEYSMRPVQIKLPNPIYGETFLTRSCILCKDPQREYKDKIADMNIPTIAKVIFWLIKKNQVIGYTSLTRKFQQFEEKRKLAREYDLFFCDYKIYDLMRKPTGKYFYDTKKYFFKK